MCSSDAASSTSRRTTLGVLVAPAGFTGRVVHVGEWATGRKNGLFAGTLAAGQRAAAITSLIQSAKLNGHDPYVYLKDMLERLPTQRASEIGQLLPHRWSPAG
jgi:hypothetical protein